MPRLDFGGQPPDTLAAVADQNLEVIGKGVIDMPYNVKWDPYHRAECIKQAEKAALHPGETWGNGFLYRFEDVVYAHRTDPYDDDAWGSSLVVELEAFNVRSWTPLGATLYFMSGSRHKFVNLAATKKFACKTVDEALESFIARKKRQAGIYEAKAERARAAIRLVQTPLVI